MKFKLTNKQVKQQFTNIKYAGYCDLSFLLNNVEPIAYTCGVYGWNYDIYVVNGLTICTGYRNMPGERLEKVREYNEKARKILSWENPQPYDKKRKAIDKLLKKFCEINGGLTNE